jgi:hypothetical protein
MVLAAGIVEQITKAIISERSVNGDLPTAVAWRHLPMKSKSKFWRKVWLFALYIVFLAMIVIAVLTLLGPTEGVIFSRMIR